MDFSLELQTFVNEARVRQAVTLGLRDNIRFGYDILSWFYLINSLLVTRCMAIIRKQCRWWVINTFKIRKEFFLSVITWMQKPSAPSITFPVNINVRFCFGKFFPEKTRWIIWEHWVHFPLLSCSSQYLFQVIKFCLPLQRQASPFTLWQIIYVVQCRELDSWYA